MAVSPRIQGPSKSVGSQIDSVLGEKLALLNLVLSWSCG